MRTEAEVRSKALGYCDGTNLCQIYFRKEQSEHEIHEAHRNNCLHIHISRRVAEFVVPVKNNPL
jgi:hypothetical protein